MPSASHERPDQQVELPDDVIDPLLWRLAHDVARAHQPDDSGRCGNLGCPDEPGPCPALRQAERAMLLARSTPTSASTSAQPTEDDAEDGLRLPYRQPGIGLRAA